jgi:hypothetical protein
MLKEFYKRVEELTNVSESILKNTKRIESVVTVRDIIIYLFKIRLKYTEVQIANEFNLKQPSSVYFAVKKINNFLTKKSTKKINNIDKLQLFNLLDSSILLVKINKMNEINTLYKSIKDKSSVKIYHDLDKKVFYNSDNWTRFIPIEIKNNWDVLTSMEKKLIFIMARTNFLKNKYDEKN